MKLTIVTAALFCGYVQDADTFRNDAPTAVARAERQAH
jgi:hypothetical protein